MKTLYTVSLLTLLLFASPAIAQHRGGAAHVGGGARGYSMPHYNPGVARNYGYSRPYYGNFNRGGYGYRPNIFNGLGYGYGYGFYSSPYGNLGFPVNCPYPYGSQAYANCFFANYGYYPY